MRDPSGVTDGDLDFGAKREARFGGLVQVAPGPEVADQRDRAGAQAGMALAIAAGGAFWAAVGAAVWFLHH